MARITVEDCLRFVENRFHLVIKAAKRARQLAMTAVDPKVPWDNDKPTVVALREIAAGYKDFEPFREAGASGALTALTSTSISTSASTSDEQ